MTGRTGDTPCSKTATTVELAMTTRDNRMNQTLLTRRRVVLGIVIAVAALHFVVGPNYRGPWRVAVASYLIDIALPFAMVLLLGISNIGILRPPILRGMLVFGAGAVVETLQYFGAPILGRTFDPADYVMYGIGVVAAIAFERTVLSRLPQHALQ